MDLQKGWQDGLRRVAAAFERLSGPEAARLDSLVRLMMEQKGAMQALVEQADAATHCAACGGACCVAGKYHFTGVDLLAYLVTKTPLFAPLFDNGLCCYLDGNRCLMPPRLRPFNCITFNCERIEDLLPEEEVARFYRLERELRENYAAIRALFPGRSLDGALLR